MSAAPDQCGSGMKEIKLITQHAFQSRNQRASQGASERDQMIFDDGGHNYFEIQNDSTFPLSHKERQQELTNLRK